jgi:hypothetical protein
MGLALGIAVEGLTKCLYADVGTPSDEWQAAVTTLKNHVAKWSGEAATPIEIVRRIQQRVGGMVGNLSSVSTQDRLHALAERGAIDKEDIQLWKELRHPAAHADSREGRDLQKFVDKCQAVTTLLYQLIFKVIGYEGVYTDYSTYHYPPRMYRGRPITRDDIATAAYYRWQQRGELPGYDLEDWLDSEKQLHAGDI